MISATPWPMTFSRSHHQLIAGVLGCLDATRLRDHGCFFAGGTALALRFGEYRESVDIDFVVSGADAYRDLRSACKRNGLDAIALPGQRAITADGMTMDQYGIRARLALAGTSIKFEIIREARISLDAPRRTDQVLGVTTATLTDQVAMKMLANSDRWADTSVFSRDILDLAMVAPRGPTLASALQKTSAAYGSDVARDLDRAIDELLEDQGRLQRCQDALAMNQPRAAVTDRLRRLRRALHAVERRTGD